jgi:hypothetical protein
MAAFPNLGALPSDALSSDRMSVLQKRTEDSLSLDTIAAIKKITLKRSKPNRVIVGSFQYSAHEYPGDIDLMETIVFKGEIEQAKAHFAAGFCAMANRLKRVRDHRIILADFKAGIDDRFAINIGEFVLASRRAMKLRLHGYKPRVIRENISELANDGLLTKSAARSMIKLVVEDPTYIQHKALRDAVRENLILRWSLDELIKGEKELPLGKRITLKEALGHQEIVKIDVWCLVGGRYIELTNLFNLVIADKQGRVTQQLSQPLGDYLENLAKDIEIYRNPALKKFMKLTKRMWSYAILTKKEHLVRIIAPLFGSTGAKLSQIQGDVETLINILENVDNPPKHEIFQELQDMKMRLSTVMDSVLSVKRAKRVYSLINELTVDTPTKYVVHALWHIYDILNVAVNRFAHSYVHRIIEKLDADTLSSILSSM